MHAYNATHSAVTRYSPHYLMFGWMPRLPLDFYFNTFRSTEVPIREASTKCVDEYVATVHEWLCTALWEAQCQKQYYDQKTGAMDLKPGDLVLVKADAFKGKRKIRDRWEDKACEVVCQITTDIPSYKVTDQHGQSCILHWNWLLLVASEVGIPLCIGVCHAWDRCTSPTPGKPTSKGSEGRMTPQENSGWAVTQCPPSKTSLGWVNGNLWLLSWMSAGVSTEDGWRLKVMCSRHEHLMDHIHLAEVTMSLPIDTIG